MLKMEKTAKKRPRTREKKPLQLRNKQGILKTRVGDSSAKTHVCGAAPHDFPAAWRRGGGRHDRQIRPNIDAKGRPVHSCQAAPRSWAGRTSTSSSDRICVCPSSPTRAGTRKWRRSRSVVQFAEKAAHDLCPRGGTVTRDAQGRILIPADLRQKAGLNKEVIVVGSFDRVEIWDAQRWARMEEEAFSSR